jgi:hypothetical protein
VVTIGVEKNLLEAAQGVDDPLVHLRVTRAGKGEGDASQNQSLACESRQEGELSNLKEEIAQGCTPKYSINQGTECPDQRTVLWNDTPQPWECVAIQTGEKVGQVSKGMNERVHGDQSPQTCVNPNNWPESEGPGEGLEPGDPRIVPVFITAFGSFSGSGNETVPVTDFGTFYVTGWAGSQSDCATDDPAEQGEIVGHFIKYVQSLNDGSAGEDECDLESNSLTPCVAVLVE